GRRTQRELVFQETRKIDGERDESAECEEIERRKNPGERLAAQHAEHRAEALRLCGDRCVSSGERKEDGPYNEQGGSGAENALPSYVAGEDGSAEYRSRLPDVAQSEHAERRPLL